jgi:DNA-binding LacI/PurR family transcriptional regulator/signal transduction histidine kinase
MTARSDRPTIGLLMDDVGYSFVYHEPLWSAVSEAARTHDVNLVCFAGDIITEPPTIQLIDQRAIYDLAAAESVDGLLLGAVLGGHLPPGELERLCARYHPPLPMVGLGLALEDIPGIFVGNTQGMRDLVVHLIEAHSCHRIAFVQGPEGSEEAEQRFRGYVEALTSHGLELDHALTLPGDFRFSGANAVRSLLDERGMRPGVDFDALVAANDAMASSALFALRSRDVQVPRDVALAGFDDLSLARNAVPPLTTVRQPFEELGRRAVDMLLALLAGKSVPERVTLPAELVIRQSCGCPNPLALHIGEGRAQGTPTSESDPAERRARILSEMVQAADVPPEAQQEIAARSALLLDTFYADLEEEKATSIFLKTLDQVLWWAVAQGDDLIAWQSILAVLHHHTLLAPADRERLARVAELWRRAWALLADIRLQNAERQRRQDQAQVFSWLFASRSIAATPDVPTLMDTVASQMLPLGLDGCYVVLYEDPASPTAWSRLVLACDENGRIEIEPGGRRFPSRQLLPEGLLSPDKAYNLLLKPLFFGDERFGFVVLVMSSPDQLIYTALSTQISGALKGTQLVQAVEAHARELEARNAELDAFAHTVAHDLKNPLSALILLSTMLQAQLKGTASQSAEDALQRISQTGYKLTAIIDELLLLSSVRKEEVQPEPLDMAGIVTEAQKRLAGMVLEYQAEITGAAEWPTVLGHAPWIEEIWVNYISNAVKYGGRPSRGVPPRVELGFEEQVNSHVRFWVRDNGRGLTSQEQARLFAPFTRLHQVRVEGHGLGLSIVQRIAEKLGGEVGVESQVGRGSVFYFTLPTAPEAEGR